MDQERADRIITALEEKGVDQPCARCGHTEFDLVGEAQLPIRAADPAHAVLPAALIACRNCGLVSYHALGRLLTTTGNFPKYRLETEMVAPDEYEAEVTHEPDRGERPAGSVPAGVANA